MDSIREALTAAYDKAETVETEAPSTDAPAADTITNAAPENSPDSPPDSGSDTQDASADEGAAPSTAPAAAAPAAPAAPETPAPASWSTEERAGWATMSDTARKAVIRREGEMQRALQTSATARKRVEALDNIAKPYAPLLNSYGITVEQAMPGLLATRAALEVGTPEQKAELVASICADFGIEIELLDSALSKRYGNGAPAPRYAPPPMPDLSNNPQLAPLFAVAEQLKAAQQERAQQAIAAVSSDPHYETVRHTMADFIDKAREQGRSLDLPSALLLAKQFHGIAVPPPSPSVSDAARTLAAARRAATSVSGAPQPTAPRKPGEGTLRDELEANFAAARR